MKLMFCIIYYIYLRNRLAFALSKFIINITLFYYNKYNYVTGMEPFKVIRSVTPIPFIAFLRILLFNRVNRTRVQTINRVRRPRPLPSFFTIPRAPCYSYTLYASPLRFTISVWYYNFGL